MKTAFAILAFLCLPCFGAEEKPIDVMAVYYPHWHEYPKGNEWFRPGWSEWDFVKNPATRFKGQINFSPFAGCLDGADPEDVETEIALASNAGITVFLYDYYYYNGEVTQEEAIERGFLKAKNRNLMKFAIMWCYHERKDRFRAAPDKEARKLMTLAHTPEEFLGLVDLSIKRYFNRPEYWRLDGRLFFSIYDFAYLWETWGRDDAKVKDAIEEARRRVRAAGLGELHVNAQNVTPKMAARFAALGIDSFTDYGFNTYQVKDIYNRFKAGEVLIDFKEIDGPLQRHWAKMRDASPAPYIPVVPTGWDSSLRCVLDDPFP
ncbi:MAG: glycoside hydrolase family 99-like domain-containing protein [Kiritimatiellae bacterium]|nr:glycoside hydrolase family 99-like domain-containing protein [Kiritimatiellia bacterium]